MAKKQKQSVDQSSIKDDSAVSQYMGDLSETGTDSKPNKKRKKSQSIAI